MLAVIGVHQRKPKLLLVGVVVVVGDAIGGLGDPPGGRWREGVKGQGRAVGRGGFGIFGGG